MVHSILFKRFINPPSTFAVDSVILQAAGSEEEAVGDHPQSKHEAVSRRCVMQIESITES